MVQTIDETDVALTELHCTAEIGIASYLKSLYVVLK